MPGATGRNLSLSGEETDGGTHKAPCFVRFSYVALLAALVTVVLWASAFVGIRAAGEDLSPGALSLGRLAIGSLLLGTLALSRGGRWPGRAELPLLVTCGVLWFGLYNPVLNEAEQRVDAGTAAMLVNVGPVPIALLAGLLLGEGFPRTLLVGVSIAFAGAIVIGVATAERGVAAGWGSVLCVVAAALYAGGVIAQKPLLSRVGAAHHLACLPDRSRRLPPLRAPALRGARRRQGELDRLDGLPRRLPDGRGVHDVGLRALADDGRPDGGHDLPRPADCDPSRLGHARREPRGSRVPRRGALPRRRRHRAASIAQVRGDRGVSARSWYRSARRREAA